MADQNKAASLFRHCKSITANITHVAYTAKKEALGPSILVSDEFVPGQDLEPGNYVIKNNSISFANSRGDFILEETRRSLRKKEVYQYCADGEPVVRYRQTANGEAAYLENMRQIKAGNAYEGKLTFHVSRDEALYGLGQHEDGMYNYNGQKEYLYQTNMKIAIPFLLSSKNYGILIDTESAVIFESGQGKITFSIDTTHELSYYVITGDNFDAIIRSLRNLTGRAPLLPRWAYGYIQSKERYNSSEELIETVFQFRKSGIPLDCIVQDWLTWEEGLWGDKHADQERFPDLRKLVSQLHAEHVKLMVSIWPNLKGEGRDLKELQEKELLLPNSATYDAFREEARKVYWKQCEEEWFSAGIDAWWCDNAEPFSDADWNGRTKRPEEVRCRIITDESRKSMDWTRLNTYGLLHSKGIYENWRAANREKRVVNLTRSTYISGQRYGTVAWSGDISAKWSVLRTQITEGIKYSMSGMPYWTLDIGAFFTVKDKWENRGCNCSGNPDPLWFWDGDYNEGVNDLGYRELYVRWLQFGVFLPMFRSHGTDTPREPWNFGQPGDIFYDTIVKYINLRYRLLPYIYSLAAQVNQNHSTMLRSLMFDFALDEKVKDIYDSFLFGNAMLVAPVIEPMYYAAGSVPLLNTDKKRELYLPNGCDWYDFWTNERFAGGQIIKSHAALDTIPVFIKAGSVIPVSDPLMYADEKGGGMSEILVYGGRDGAFSLYNDEGDNYSYEKGNFSAISLSYEDSGKTIKFGKAAGLFKYQEHFRIRLIEGPLFSKVREFWYQGEEETVCLGQCSGYSSEGG